MVVLEAVIDFQPIFNHELPKACGYCFNLVRYALITLEERNWLVRHRGFSIPTESGKIVLAIYKGIQARKRARLTDR
jgi:predicted transcriptional regulator